MRLPHREQNRGGSRALPQPLHTDSGRPQPVQCASSAGEPPGDSAAPSADCGDPIMSTGSSSAQSAEPTAPIGIRRSDSMRRSSSADLPRVVR